MKKICALAFLIGMWLLFAGAASAQGRGDGGGQGMRGGPGATGDRGGEATLTDAQKEAIKSILSKYSPSSLTAADAKAIHHAFHESGIRPGPAERQAIQTAGFDPEKLRELDPPPDRQGRDQEGSRGGEGAGQGRGGSKQNQQ